MKTEINPLSSGQKVGIGLLAVLGIGGAAYFLLKGKTGAPSGLKITGYQLLYPDNTTGPKLTPGTTIEAKRGECLRIYYEYRYSGEEQIGAKATVFLWLQGSDWLWSDPVDKYAYEDMTIEFKSSTLPKTYYKTIDLTMDGLIEGKIYNMGLQITQGGGHWNSSMINNAVKIIPGGKELKAAGFSEAFITPAITNPLIGGQTYTFYFNCLWRGDAERKIKYKIEQGRLEPNPILRGYHFEPEYLPFPSLEKAVEGDIVCPKDDRYVVKIGPITWTVPPGYSTKYPGEDMNIKGSFDSSFWDYLNPLPGIEKISDTFEGTSLKDGTVPIKPPDPTLTIFPTEVMQGKEILLTLKSFIKNTQYKLTWQNNDFMNVTTNDVGYVQIKKFLVDSPLGAYQVTVTGPGITSPVTASYTVVTGGELKGEIGTVKLDEMMPLFPTGTIGGFTEVLPCNVTPSNNDYQIFTIVKNTGATDAEMSIEWKVTTPSGIDRASTALTQTWATLGNGGSREWKDKIGKINTETGTYKVNLILWGRRQLTGTPEKLAVFPESTFTVLGITPPPPVTSTMTITPQQVYQGGEITVQLTKCQPSKTYSLTGLPPGFTVNIITDSTGSGAAIIGPIGTVDSYTLVARALDGSGTDVTATFQVIPPVIMTGWISMPITLVTRSIGQYITLPGEIDKPTFAFLDLNSEIEAITYNSSTTAIYLNLEVIVIPPGGPPRVSSYEWFKTESGHSRNFRVSIGYANVEGTWAVTVRLLGKPTLETANENAQILDAHWGAETEFTVRPSANNPVLTCNPPYLRQGETLSFTWSGFLPNVSLSIRVRGGGGADFTTSTGGGTSSFVIGEVPGSYILEAIQGSVMAEDAFIVLPPPYIGVANPVVDPGASLTFYWDGFTPNGQVYIGIVMGSGSYYTSDNTGYGSATILAPNVPGTYMLQAAGDNFDLASDTFEVRAAGGPAFPAPSIPAGVYWYYIIFVDYSGGWYIEETALAIINDPYYSGVIAYYGPYLSGATGSG